MWAISRVRSWPALLLLVLLAGVTLGGAADGSGPAASGDTQDTGGTESVSSPSLAVAVGTTASELSWSTTTTGDFAVRLVLDFDAGQLCAIRFRSAGQVTSDPVHAYQAHDEPGRTWTALTQDHIAGTHVSDVSVHTDAPFYHRWAASAIHEFNGFGTEAWLFAGNALLPWDNPFTGDKTLIIDLECTGPFTIVSIEGGKKVVGSTPAYMRGGAGAHTPVADVNVADHTGASFSQPHVAFRYRSDVSFGAGQLLLTGPGMSEDWMLTGDAEASADGPAGEYQASMVRAAGGGKGAVLVMAGLEEVGSLDGAAAL